jgi:hypothetical protein
MDALKFNLRQEHVVICDFVSTFHQVRPFPTMKRTWACAVVPPCTSHAQRRWPMLCMTFAMLRGACMHASLGSGMLNLLPAPWQPPLLLPLPCSRKCSRKLSNIVCVLHPGFPAAAQTLTPVQNARFIVSSYPFFPDTVAVSLWIAALDQDAEALGRLRAAGAL